MGITARMEEESTFKDETNNINLTENQQAEVVAAVATAVTDIALELPSSQEEDDLPRSQVAEGEQEDVLLHPGEEEEEVRDDNVTTTTIANNVDVDVADTSLVEMVGVDSTTNTTITTGTGTGGGTNGTTGGSSENQNGDVDVHDTTNNNHNNNNNNETNSG